jgi:AAA domain/UvrD-like helicase C-terminal domain
VDPQLRLDAQAIIEALPAALEMPAGTGKTHLVAAMTAIAEKAGSTVLVLTHTHAGIDAIRSRLVAFGVSMKHVHIDTITGWAFDLVRAYPTIAGIKVPEEPDWTRSSEYVTGAARVAASHAIRDMHAARFDLFVVDEYQDCNDAQHRLVLAISEAIPKTCVLGDRLQGIFDFRGQHLVDWDTDVFPRFPLYPQVHLPHRWNRHNEALGQWLISIRPALLQSQSIDLAAVQVDGFTWGALDQKAFDRAAFATRPIGESVLILGQWERDVDGLASRLKGIYGVMENVQGDFMAKFLGQIDGAPSSRYAHLLALFAKKCFAGLGGINGAVLMKLEAGKGVGNLKRPGLGGILSALDALMESPSLTQLATTMLAFDDASTARLFKREAWWDVRRAIERAAPSGLTTVSSLAQIRDTLRHSGRRPAKRVVSRTVLVKGLEYDHVIVANAGMLTSSRNLYVAMSRARKTLTVFSPASVLLG